MTERTYDIRPGECLIEADKTFLVTSKFDVDSSGRHIPIGVQADTPTIVGAAEGRAVAEQKPYVKVVKGDRGVLPPRFSAGDSAGQDAFLGRKREPTRDQKVKALLEVEELGPISLADSCQRLIDAGIFDRPLAVEWGQQERRVAVLSGTGSKEPWVNAAKRLIAEKEA